MTHSSTSRNLAKIAEVLDGSRFVVVGLTKHDWLYEGLDATYQIWRHLEYDPDRFRLIGFNTQLPEVVADKWEVATRKSVFDMLQEPFFKCIKWMNDNLNLSTGAALFLIAVILRLVFFPIGLLEACSRMKRAKIKHALKAELKPVWAPSAKTLMKHLKISGGWELLGTFIMLMLVLPAYKLILLLPESFKIDGFLWIDNITKPDYILSAIIGGLIFLKLRLGTSSKKRLPPLLITLAFILLLFYLPSSLLVYVSGVLSITVLQDLIALEVINKAMNRALLTSE